MNDNDTVMVYVERKSHVERKIVVQHYRSGETRSKFYVDVDHDIIFLKEKYRDPKWVIFDGFEVGMGYMFGFDITDFKRITVWRGEGEKMNWLMFEFLCGRCKEIDIPSEAEDKMQSLLDEIEKKRKNLQKEK